MNNFWDAANLDGVHDMFFEHLSSAVDQHNKSLDKPEVAARPTVRREALSPACVFQAVHEPFVFVRAEPSTRARALGTLRPTSREQCCVLADVEWDGWVRTAEPYANGEHGWLLADGSRLGLGQLVRRL